MRLDLHHESALGGSRDHPLSLIDRFSGYTATPWEQISKVHDEILYEGQGPEMTLANGPAFDRRGFLKLAGLSWLTPVGQLLADQAERSRQPAQSIILLWLGGGPSQLETFDPHPDTRIAGGTKAIATAVPGIQLAQGFEQLADQMGSVALIRSMVSKEGDHERGTYLMKTGYRPDPTVEHPSIGAICCHELPVGRTDIPRHISILTGQWPSPRRLLGGRVRRVPGR